MADHTKRLIGSGQAHNGHSHLFGVTINKLSPQDTTVEIRDSLDASGEIIWEAALPNATCLPKNFWPWLEFHVGIYVVVTGPLESLILEIGDN